MDALFSWVNSGEALVWSVKGLICCEDPLNCLSACVSPMDLHCVRPPGPRTEQPVSSSRFHPFILKGALSACAHAGCTRREMSYCALEFDISTQHCGPEDVLLQRTADRSAPTVTSLSQCCKSVSVASIYITPKQTSAGRMPNVIPVM